jgi:N-acetylglucosamine-6-sulfatase
MTGDRSGRKPKVVGILMVALVGLVAFPVGSRSASSPISSPIVSEDWRRTPPNIVLILTDDQRWDTLWAMPNVQSLLVDRGITFSNAFVVNALCCPSRVSLLTGQYSHTSLVYANTGSHGGFESFDGDGSTIATWLSDAGYRTALIGKYLNEYRSTYIPPGWDRWIAFTSGGAGGAYYDYDLNVDGQIEHRGNEDEDYSTDVLSAEADRFIRGVDAGSPLFLYFSPFAVHSPTTPAPRHGEEFSDLEPYRPPNYNERDVTDKPEWVQGLPRLSRPRRQELDELRIDQYRSLLAVDEAVATVVTALRDTGRLSNSLIVFASDNGLSLGEHRWRFKRVAYEESIRVPMVLRFDALISESRREDHLVLNIDVAPTFAEVAGVPSPGVDGRSLRPLIVNPDTTSWRTEFLIENLRLRNQPLPTFCSVRSETFTYVLYQTGEEELYDLALDFYQLGNVAGDPSYASVLLAMRGLEAALCDPPPPGWP